MSVGLERDQDRHVVLGRMAQPIPQIEAFDQEASLLQALGVEKSRLPIEAYRNGPTFVYVALEDEEEVAAVTPNMAALKALKWQRLALRAAAVPGKRASSSRPLEFQRTRPVARHPGIYYRPRPGVWGALTRSRAVGL